MIFIWNRSIIKRPLKNILVRKFTSLPMLLFIHPGQLTDALSVRALPPDRDNRATSILTQATIVVDLA